MDPNEMFELIGKGDDKVEYATTGKQVGVRQQVIDPLRQAQAAAREIGSDALVQQAEIHPTDLGKTGP
jgi:hypothetical protein